MNDAVIERFETRKKYSRFNKSKALSITLSRGFLCKKETGALKRAAIMKHENNINKNVRLMSLLFLSSFYFIMQIFNYLAFAFFSVFTVFAQDGSGGNGTTSNATIFELLSSNTSTYNSSRFISLLNSDSGYQPIIQLLSEPTSNLTAFIPNDAVLNRVFTDFREHNQDQGINSTSEYPPANWTYHNMSVLDLLQYHVVNESFLLTNLTTSNVSVVHSLLNNSAVNHFVNSSLPILIQANTTYENATNQTWLDINAKYLKFNVGNGVNSSTVLLKDLNATNGHFNIINSGKNDRQYIRLVFTNPNMYFCSAYSSFGAIHCDSICQECLISSQIAT
jgi:hypothetical protein